MTDEASWEDTLKRLARSVDENLAVHPDPEAFLAHRRGELPAAEVEALEEHLAWCRDCAGIWRDLPQFLEGDAEPFDPEEKAADWRALQAQLETAAPPADEEPPPAARPASRSRLAAGLAAALALAVGGSALWIANLSQRLEDDRRPRPNVAIHDLSPPAAVRAGEEPPLSIRLDRNAVLVLNVSAELEDRAYEARILDGEGEPVWTIDGLEPGRFGNFTLELPAGSLDPGLYRIVVQGGEGEPAVGEYAVRVVEPAGDRQGS
jgi:hypothetical protein